MSSDRLFRHCRALYGSDLGSEYPTRLPGCHRRQNECYLIPKVCPGPYFEPVSSSPGLLLKSPSAACEIIGGYAALPPLSAIFIRPRRGRMIWRLFVPSHASKTVSPHSCSGHFFDVPVPRRGCTWSILFYLRIT